jgi:Activator of Hsp90 ATPase homolog 1-like protein
MMHMHHFGSVPNAFHLPSGPSLAACPQPKGASSRILAHDQDSGSLRMEITHGPGPEGTRRFHLMRLETREDELVVYGAAFETNDSLLAGAMRLHFTLKNAPRGTRVTVRHEGIPPRVTATDNERGTASFLSNLARRVEGPYAQSLD